MEELVVHLDRQLRLGVDSFDGEATVLFRHDDATPDYYAMFQLQSVFGLSDELAEHVIRVARETGVAYVVTRPRDEAGKLIHSARIAAQMFGFNLVFGLEQDLRRPEPDTQGAARKFAVCSFILCLTWCLILCVSLSHVP